MRSLTTCWHWRKWVSRVSRLTLMSPSRTKTVFHWCKYSMILNLVIQAILCSYTLPHNMLVIKYLQFLPLFYSVLMFKYCSCFISCSLQYIFIYLFIAIIPTTLLACSLSLIHAISCFMFILHFTTSPLDLPCVTNTWWSLYFPIIISYHSHIHTSFITWKIKVKRHHTAPHIRQFVTLSAFKHTWEELKWNRIYII